MRTNFIPSQASVPGTTPGVGSPSSDPNLNFLDRDLTVYRDGMRWSFADGKVLLDGQDVSQLVSHPNADIGFWLGLAGSLAEYRKRVAVLKAKRDSDQFSRLNGMVDALLGKIAGRLKKAYDQKMSGLSWTMENGQFLLNGINVRSFMALYRLRKTNKAKKFLKGLRSKLALLLQNQHESADYDRIRYLVEELYQEVERELGFETQDEASRHSVLLLPQPA